MTDTTSGGSGVQRWAFFSYGFRPFFLGAALFAGVALPVWVLMFNGAGHSIFSYAPREWHVHEMLFGFLPAVIAGFLLTAMPNWTERPPITGISLMLLWGLWLAGRVVLALPWLSPLVSAGIDGGFLVVMAMILWREIAIGKAWDRVPIGVLLSVYAGANLFFHTQALRGTGTDLSERLALSVIILLLALIGGRVVPSFTLDFLNGRGMVEQPAAFSRFDGIAILLAGIAAVAWVAQPEATSTGELLVLAGLIHVVRLGRWYGWVTWREPLVLILHLGYGWLAMSMLILGGAILGLGLQTTDAVHALTTGAVGAMTLAIMTRASLGHTGRPRHAGPMTVMIYILVNLGAVLRVFGPATVFSTPLVLGLSAMAWSGAYLLFAFVYGRFLFRPGLDGD